MKHSSKVMALALLCAYAARAEAQPAAPAPAAPLPAPPGPPSPAPSEPGAAEAPAPVPPGTAPPAPAPSAEPGQEPSPVPAPAEPAQAPTPAAPTAVAPAPAPAVDAAPQTPAPTTEATEAARPARAKPLLGLAVGTPDTGPLPGRFTPAFGVTPRSANDWQFDFHGYLNVPFRVGINERENPNANQYERVLHGPPLVPDEYERFEHTGVLPEPWVQLNFSYGNANVAATIIIAARTVSNASGFFDPPRSLGINDAFLTFKPDFEGFDLEFDVGGFANRYGGMGEYDLGRYDTPLIARVGGVGETTRLRAPLAGGLTFLAEHGLMSQFDRAQLGVEPAGWNSFSDANVGTSFAHHAHLGLAASELGQIGLHYVHAFTQDDRTAPSQADGSITVLGADVTGHFGLFGRVYLGAAYTDADQARGVSGVIRVLNTFGGPGLMQEYFGVNSGGTGTLLTLGGQYDLSVGQLLRHPQPFSGYGPDLVVSLFGMYTGVGSEDPAFDDVDKLKYGGEVSYSVLSWLAFSGRYDRVVANADDASQTFAVLSPRIILRTDYNSQDQITLSYSRFFYGSGVVVRPTYPKCPPLIGAPASYQCGDPSVEPDADMISLTASMWW